MAMVQVTAHNFEATIERGIVLLDWWAAWCGPCRLFAPIFEAASARHPDVVFGKVDMEVEQGLAEAFDIRAIPTLMVLRDGVLLASQPGVLPAGAIDELIARARELDMADVRRQVELQTAAAEGPAQAASQGEQ